MSRYDEKCAYDAIQDKMAEYRDQQREAMRSACENCDSHKTLGCLYYDPEEAIPKADYETRLTTDMATIKQLSSSVKALQKANSKITGAYDKLKSDYEARLKDNMVAMLTELSMKIGEIEDGHTEFDEENKRSLTMIPLESVERLIDGKINKLKEEQNK